jgi:hypothetical protein
MWPYQAPLGTPAAGPIRPDSMRVTRAGGRARNPSPPTPSPSLSQSSLPHLPRFLSGMDREREGQEEGEGGDERDACSSPLPTPAPWWAPPPCPVHHRHLGPSPPPPRHRLTYPGDRRVGCSVLVTHTSVTRRHIKPSERRGRCGAGGAGWLVGLAPGRTRTRRRV